MKIIIAGDLVSNGNLLNHFILSEVDNLLDVKLLDIWNSSDFRIFNLELPLIDCDSKALKNGPNLKSDPKTINGIIKLNPNLVNLANNHIMDYGVEGLIDTLNLLKTNNIDFIGAGNNLIESKKHFIINKDNFNIGIYNCAEHEFGIATEHTPGANPFDPLTSLDDIEELSKQVDYTIVIYHGGKEYYRYPSPYLQKACRRMVDKGADFVVTQHSHCIGSREVYKGKTIVYGQGNFLFNYGNKMEDPFWNNGMLVEITLDKDMEKIEYIPYLTTLTGIRLANDTEKKDILGSFNMRSEEIKNPEFLREKYNEFSYQHIDNYLSALSGQNKWLKRIDRRIFKGKLTNWYYSQKKLLAIQNYVECEAHRELLLQGIKNKVKIKRR